MSKVDDSAAKGAVTISLAPLQLGGWLESIFQDPAKYKTVSHVIGQTFLALSHMAGVQITSIMLRGDESHHGIVEFLLPGMDTKQKLGLDEFRERLTKAVLLGALEETVPPTLSEDTSSETLQNYLGIPYIMLAAVFGISLDSLIVKAGEDPRIRWTMGTGTMETTVAGFRESIRARVAQDLQAFARPEAATINLDDVIPAQEAFEKDDHDLVVALLGPWREPLFAFARSGNIEGLVEDVRHRIMEGLNLLSLSYKKKGLSEVSEEVVRLAIQCGRDDPSTAPFYAELGHIRMAQGRSGEAIGHLRRAIELGSADAGLMLDLAQCFVERKRYVAALGCLRRVASNIPAKHALWNVYNRINAEVSERLGGAYQKYQGFS